MRHDVFGSYARYYNLQKDLLNSLTEACVFRKLHWNIVQVRKYLILKQHVEMRFFSKHKFKFSVIDYKKKFM